ncbi:methyltransferase domain-containing protein [Clostridium sp. MCC353]|uniref:class I SAM-dependent methyltransferase n=1 Tax=Clostridium sp. MCC353 TaxID=2592646 RepID=UPI001C0258B5|nr:class I SAM-dependent methyltransferase [Clostridium sp. MCC353]MBT9775056.1 methyltransferase domain-containing protein [Clostridium sp. MCC353]
MIKKKDFREETKRYFDNTALDYDNSGDRKFVQCLYGEITARAAAIPAKTVLDLGCGNGNIIGMLRQQMEAAFYGADISGEMIREARKRLGEEVKLDVADAAELPYDDEMFDLVICNASFHHYTDPVKAVMEIRRVLKKGGTLILGDPTIPGRVFLKLLNWSLHQGNTGDCRIYCKKDIVPLFAGHGFVVENWKSVNYRTFVFNAVKM